MPLVIVCGLPCVGKSSFAQALHAYITERDTRRCVVVNEESMGITKASGYADATAEKNTRGNLKSGVDHALDSETIVILDSMNYIKGYRYELYCIARSQRTPHCVVWVQNDKSTAQMLNETRPDAYTPQIFEELWMRFEAPNESNRWDKPLFVITNSTVLSPCPSETKHANADIDLVENVSVSRLSVPLRADSAELKQPGDVSLERSRNSAGTTAVESIPKIYEFLTTAVPPQQSLATIVTPRSEADTLYMLDKRTNAIVQHILRAQQSGAGTGRICIPETTNTLTLNRTVAAAELQRHRRQFIRLHTLHPPTSSEAISDAFVEYLCTHVNS